MPLFFEPKWKSYIVVTTTPVLTPEQCDQIITVGRNQPLINARVHIGKPGNKKRDGVDSQKRISKVCAIPFNEATSIYKAIEHNVTSINVNFFGFDGVQLTEGGQYTEYEKGGFYDWHADSSHEMSMMPRVRKVSMTLLLNDPKEFKGGQFQIINEDRSVSLKKGYAVFFASFLRHRVTPVTKGNRKSFVMWFGGPPLK
mgnify:CR=1 FL=1|tara:strand:+ start:35 stop:631 length:597 start_codon:yes stop_codon:yes gene_type:complete